MAKRLFLAASVFFALFIQAVYGVEREEINQLTEVMVKGCSLGQKIDISVEADGKLSFIIGKGAKGTFKASKSEIPSIIDFLLKEEAKERQADKTRECMQKYMDKIFDAVLGSTDGKKTSLTPPINRYSLRFIGFSRFGSLEFQPSPDGLTCQARGVNIGFSGYTKASPIDIGNKRTLILKIKNSGDSVFSKMDKMIKVTVGINDLALHANAEEYLSDDPEYIIKMDGEFAYTIPNDLVKDGRIQKIGFIFSSGEVKNIEIEAWFQ